MQAQREKFLAQAREGSLTARDMRSEDLSQVLQIERNVHISPWGRISFEESMTKQHQCRVLCVGDELVGYHIVCPVVDELHILNVAAASHLQGLGLGHKLMQDIIDISKKQGLSKLFLEVRLSNTIAQSLYQKWQFKQIAVRKQYYRPVSKDAKREDALIYVKELAS